MYENSTKPVDFSIASANLVQNTQPLTAPNKIVCQICDKKGHPTLTCYKCHNEQRFPSIQIPNHRYRGMCTSSSVNVVCYPYSNPIDHVTPDLDNLKTSNLSQVAVAIANGNLLSISYINNSKVLNDGKNLSLNNILHVPTISKNFLSINKLCSDN